MQSNRHVHETHVSFCHPRVLPHPWLAVPALREPCRDGQSGAIPPRPSPRISPRLLDRSAVVENPNPESGPAVFSAAPRFSLERPYSDASERYDPGFAIPLSNRMAFVKKRISPTQRLVHQNAPFFGDSMARTSTRRTRSPYSASSHANANIANRGTLRILQCARTPRWATQMSREPK